MEFAVHYSRVAANLLAQGRISFDRFKCPAWPDLVEAVRQTHPTYVHFALIAGGGSCIDGETKRDADWATIETLLQRTGTPFINVHLSPTVHDYPDIPQDTEAPGHVERLAEALIRDVRAVAARFGPERVILENDHDNGGLHLRPAFLPEVIRSVVEETRCGLLLDVSHARLAARYLGRDAWEYLAALPLTRTREIHLTGLQHFDEQWAAFFCRGGLDTRLVAPFVGRLMDHLPLTEADWAFTARAVEQVRQGAWGAPWAVALEYGGVGPLWEASTDAAVLEEQVPRLYDLIKRA